MINLESLNTGLSRVVSVKNYPATRRQRLPRNTKGRVFRLGVLHSKEMTEAMLLKNRRGFINSQVNTVAHAPSMYHWLFHRCGVPFEETRELVSSGRLIVDGVSVDASQLETQVEWSTLQKMDIRIRVETAPVGRTSGISFNSDARGGVDDNSQSVLWVPALKRALHRQYFFVYIHPAISMTSDQADPRSFVHRLTPIIGSSATIGMNILRPIGFMNGMKGLGLATNDVSMVRYWNNEFLGNYGVYDVRFARGVPSEVVHSLAVEVNKALDDGIKRQLSKDVTLPCSCRVEPVVATSPKQEQYGQRNFRQGNDFVAELYSKSLHDERIVIRSPLLPYRMAQKIRRAGGFTTLVRSGPFAFPPSLPKTKLRPLSPQELAMMFAFERKLKTNRVILSLREFDADNNGEENGESDFEEMLHFASDVYRQGIF